MRQEKRDGIPPSSVFCSQALRDDALPPWEGLSRLETPPQTHPKAVFDLGTLPVSQGVAVTVMGRLGAHCCAPPTAELLGEAVTCPGALGQPVAEPGALCLVHSDVRAGDDRRHHQVLPLI